MDLTNYYMPCNNHNLVCLPYEQSKFNLINPLPSIESL